MLKRCYSPKFVEENVTYDDCFVCDEWLNLSLFKKWFDSNYKEGMQLDKDILEPNSRVYSENTCAYVSKQLNVLFVESFVNRGEYPLGVSLYKPNGRFKAECTKHGKVYCVGYYDTPEDAHRAYKEYKRKHILDVVNLQRGIDSNHVLDVIEKRYS